MYKKLFALAIFGVTAAAAQATTYPGNGATGFGGPVGDAANGASLTFTSDGTTLFGTITTPTTATSLSDELVIYLNTTAGGFTSTATFTDTGGATSNANGDVLRRATSGFGFSGGPSGTTVTRSTVNFAPTFGADFAIALSPNNAFFGSLYTLDNPSNFTFDGSINLSPTNANGPYTFSIALALLGNPTSFDFATTYLNSHSDIFRSNEAYNSVSDVTNPGNTGNLGTDTAQIGFNTFAVVPEPASLALIACGAPLLLALRRRK
ncbi:MAG: trimeric autotransporter adhesin [Verrucomicrobiota bacterium]